MPGKSGNLKILADGIHFHRERMRNLFSHENFTLRYLDVAYSCQQKPCSIFLAKMVQLHSFFNIPITNKRPASFSSTQK